MDSPNSTANMSTVTNGGSGVGRVDADQPPGPAALQDQGDHAVGGGDRQQVHHRGLDRHGDAAERDEQQQHREQDDPGDQVRDAAGQVGGAVDRRGRRRHRRGPWLRCRRRPPGRWCPAGGAPGPAWPRPAGRCCGTTVRTAVSPAWLSSGGVTDATPGVAVAAARSRVQDRVAAGGKLDGQADGSVGADRRTRRRSASYAWRVMRLGLVVARVREAELHAQERHGQREHRGQADRPPPRTGGAGRARSTAARPGSA